MKKHISQSFYYDNLRDIYHQICENQYRTTASGRRVARDEPDETTQFKQSDAIQAKFKAQRVATTAAAGREALKKKGSVPVKLGGKKLFDEFMREANSLKNEKLSKKDQEYVEQIYNSARALPFDKWFLFISEML